MTGLPVDCQRIFEMICNFVREELCERNELEVDAFEMSHRALKRSGEPCGYYFCVHGPRSVKLTAVWDFQKRAIYFYDSLGRRTASRPEPIYR